VYRISEIINAVNTQVDIGTIMKAYVFSAKVHCGQLRKSGEPYLSHPLAVAVLMVEMHLDVATICAALLHDTIEDTSATLEDISRILGPEIAILVDGVTKINLLAAPTKSVRQAESLRKMILAMASDIRILLIKLADRLHNIRTLEYMPPKKQRAIARETLDIYAPMAHRLGIRCWQAELEDLSLYYLEPQLYRQIQFGIALRQKDCDKFIAKMRGQLRIIVNKHGIECKVDGRPKHFYSIYQKMRCRGVEIDGLYDLIAFRVVVASVKECYDALGIIHNTWKPIPGRFCDYIGMPKPNMYQSLHTSVVGPLGKRVEIQIRTEEMHHIAEDGIAAHWQYKEQSRGDEFEEKRFSWLKRLLDWQRDMKDPKEFMQSLRMDLYHEEIFVFTPDGEVKELPRKATPVDFAYSVHTEIGHQCVGAKVNGRIVPLHYELSTGDQMEVFIQPDHKPSKDWLNFVVSSRARFKISSFIRENERSRAINLGRELMDREFRKYNLTLNAILKEGKLDPVLSALSYKDVDLLLAAIAYGKLTSRLVVNRIMPQCEVEPEKFSFLKRSFSRFFKRSGKEIKIRGVDDVLIHFAKCCNPLPGDCIVGYISRGRGISIHLTSCPQVIKKEIERVMEIEWDEPENQMRPVQIQIESGNHSGILAGLAGVLKQRNINIIEAKVNTVSDYEGVTIFLIKVRDAHQLKLILTDLRRIKGVHSVKRLGLD